jgi:hypothetical protein
MDRFAWPSKRSIKGASGPTMKAIQNQNLGDLPRSRAIFTARGIEAIKTIIKLHHIQHPPVASGHYNPKRAFSKK